MPHHCPFSVNLCLTITCTLGLANGASKSAVVRCVADVVRFDVIEALLHLSQSSSIPLLTWFRSSILFKMGSSAPIAIGTRGTVGSLVRREIEFFKRLDLDCSGSTASKRIQESGNSRVLINTKPASHSMTSTTTSTSTDSRGSFLMMSWRKKNRKKRGFLPSMCSAVDVSEVNRFDKIPGFSYRSIKADMELCK